jgi:hypothetical protein
MEIIERRAVDQRGKLARTHAELVANGRKAQDKVQVLAGLLYEELHQVFGCVLLIQGAGGGGQGR